MGFLQRVLQGALLILGGWLSLLLAGLLAGSFVGVLTAATTYLLLGALMRLSATGVANPTGLCLAGAIAAGLFAFGKTFRWFATLGGLLGRR